MAEDVVDPATLQTEFKDNNHPGWYLLGCCERRLWSSRLNGSLRLGTVSHLFCSSSTFAIAGANLVSAADRNRGSTSRNRPINFATSSK